MDIKYRILNSNDNEHYRQIRLECLIENPDFFGTSYDDEVKSKSLKFDNALKENSHQNFLYGAFQDKDLIGICGFTREHRIKTKHRGEISQMFVKKNYARQSIGTKLLELTLQKAFNENEIETVILGVVDINKNAISLYKKLGFVQFGFIDNYFKQANNYLGFIFMALTKTDYLQLATLNLTRQKAAANIGLAKNWQPV